jgi:hypothetical protein
MSHEQGKGATGVIRKTLATLATLATLPRPACQFGRG